MTDLAYPIRSERLALIDYLETLTPEQWSVPSLCGEWTVQDVAAHLASAPALSPAGMVTGVLGTGFRPNKFGADSSKQWSQRGPVAILDQLRVNAARNAKPPFVPRVAVLTDAVVHALDIRRPLGSSRPIAADAFKPTADFVAGARWPVSMMIGGSVQKRIAGLRLVADDQDWTWGAGPEVHASGEALLLMLTGRSLGADELTGPGAATLAERN